ncbi:MAG TPA: ferric iron uptake transcriptional regulator [Xanthomonadales bacterium]|nr:ferric iron uptake transcriptional regulator [Xanthomonadales bacterium]
MQTKDLKEAGLKITHPRKRILNILEDNVTKHMTADDIYRSLVSEGEDIGLATVYRVLNQFETAGIAVKHNFEGGQAYYELDEGSHHDHMVDVDSGEVFEFVNEQIEKLQHEIAAEYGYEIVDHSLVLYVRKNK